MDMAEKFPSLDHFFGCYFYQSWRSEYENEEMAIKGYVDGDGPEEACRVVRELDQLLALDLPEAEFDRVMYEDLDCYYNPKPRGVTMSEWLRWVRATLLKYEQSASEKNS